ncbi:MAG: hypothetical protein JXQ69_03450, partial [Paludibacteraceae bacterium]|nr:hypothetical protein [Paludibacteraceae bacterium]
MKKLAVILSILFISFVNFQAQTIALHSTSGVQLFKGGTALADAYMASQSGDTLYLSGHTFTPPAAFDKQL